MAKKMIPEFKSEEEEMAFWDEHDLEEFGWESADDIILAIKPEPKKAVTLRLEPSLIDRLKAVAKREGIPYQTITRGLIKLGLKRLERAS